MELSKTDFIQYLNCPNSLWLLSNKPGSYPHGEFTEYAKKLAADGFLVEDQVRALVNTYPNAKDYSFQQIFETHDGLYAKADMVVQNGDGTVDLFEIKSSTSVKDKNPHNQLKDAAFQTIAAMRCGAVVRKIFIVHLNKSYIREGAIDPAKLLAFSDETVRIKGLIPETEAEIAEALALLAKDKIDESSCSCLYLSSANHCDSFGYFNPTIPEPSIYSLPRISQKKIETFVDDARFSLDAIDIGELTKLQQPILASHQTGSPYVNEADIENFLSVLKFPLYHLDYETYSSAIPIVDGLGPQGQLPFQFSLHIEQENGDLEHHDYLADIPELPLKLVEMLEQKIGPTGSIVVWNKTFENTQNKNMAAMFPEKSEFLLGLVERTVDLMDVFKTGYVDIKFGGSTSIKKVLPVIVPDLSYEGMDVADGTAAMDAWSKMLAESDAGKKAELRKALLDYCELDTLAMVRILDFVSAQSNTA